MNYTGGHMDTLIVPTTNVAVGEAVGAVQRASFGIRCMFAYGHYSVSRRGYYQYIYGVPGTYWSGINYMVPMDNLKVITNQALDACGIGFVAKVKNFNSGRGEAGNLYYNETSIPFGGQPTQYMRHFGYPDRYGNADGEGYYSIGGDFSVEYRFIKINNNFAASAVNESPYPCSNNPSSLTVANFKIKEYYVPNSREPDYWKEDPVYSDNIPVTVNIPTFHFAQRTCTTPYVDEGVVRLPMINQNDLPRVGSVGPVVEFNLKVNCPANLGYIGYYIQPVHGIAEGASARGVININPASTAKGIGLQITTRVSSSQHVMAYQENLYGRYFPVNLHSTGNSFYLLGSGYSRFGTGPDGDPLNDRQTYQTVPLRVRVYRTGDVVPGTYNAAIWVHMAYP